MSENDVEDRVLTLTEKNDPDDCRNVLHAECMQGCEDITIQVHGMSSDTREWGGCTIFLDKERIKSLYKFLGEHLAILVGKQD